MQTPRPHLTVLFLVLGLLLPLPSCGDDHGGQDPDASQSRDSGAGADAQLPDATSADSAAPDASHPADAGGQGVTSTLVASGCPATLSSSRVIVHYNTSLGITFTDPDSPYSVRGTISFDFPSTFTGEIPNPYSWVESGIHKEVAVTDSAYTTWGNHCWPMGETPSGGSGTISLVNGPSGVVRATFQGFQLRNCVSQSSTCSLTGSIESAGTGVFE
ncbi:MAG: hypothetical protein RBU30_13285 [Polyangia bacterium]|mgnify:CR=1 FL=1|jgi:hypothetical protein|nr:hypothetical protein [Polyangia bacterium]